MPDWFNGGKYIQLKRVKWMYTYTYRACIGLSCSSLASIAFLTPNLTHPPFQSSQSIPIQSSSFFGIKTCPIHRDDRHFHTPETMPWHRHWHYCCRDSHWHSYLLENDGLVPPWEGEHCFWVCCVLPSLSWRHGWSVVVSWRVPRVFHADIDQRYTVQSLHRTWRSYQMNFGSLLELLDTRAVQRIGWTGGWYW